jgi:hypothetical protein
MKTKFSLMIGLAFFFTLTSMTIVKLKPSVARVTFTVQGNGKGTVYLGCGEEVGQGGRYSVTKDAHIYITAEEGFNLYDDKSKQVIIKVNRELQGKTVDLKNYY